MVTVEGLRETAELLRETADEMEAAGRPRDKIAHIREGANDALARAAFLMAEIARREGLS